MQDKVSKHEENSASFDTLVTSLLSKEDFIVKDSETFISENAVKLIIGISCMTFSDIMRNHHYPCAIVNTQNNIILKMLYYTIETLIGDNKKSLESDEFAETFQSYVDEVAADLEDSKPLDYEEIRHLLADGKYTDIGQLIDAYMEKIEIVATKSIPMRLYLAILCELHGRISAISSKERRKMDGKENGDS